jgi:transposase InsO family protein
VRNECLDWLLILDARHLRHVLDRYVRHYNAVRPHRSLNLEAPLTSTAPSPASITQLNQIQRDDVLGGLIHEYRHAA